MVISRIAVSVVRVDSESTGSFTLFLPYIQYNRERHEPVFFFCSQACRLGHLSAWLASLGDDFPTLTIIWPPDSFLRPSRQSYLSSASSERWESKGDGPLNHREPTVLTVVVDFTDITTQRRKIKRNGAPRPFYLCANMKSWNLESTKKEGMVRFKEPPRTHNEDGFYGLGFYKPSHTAPRGPSRHPALHPGQWEQELKQEDRSRGRLKAVILTSCHWKRSCPVQVFHQTCVWICRRLKRGTMAGVLIWRN